MQVRAGGARHRRRPKRWRTAGARRAPRSTAAGVSDIDGLESKVAESRELDAGIKTADCGAGVRLRAQIGALSGAAEELREASRRAAASRAALGDVPLDSMAAEIAKLGADPVAGLRKRRDSCPRNSKPRAQPPNQASTDRRLPMNASGACSRRSSRRSLRETALKAFPRGVDAALVGGEEGACRRRRRREKTIAAEITKLESKVAAKKKRKREAALAIARNNCREREGCGRSGAKVMTESVMRPCVCRTAS